MAISPTRSREIQLFDPPPDGVDTIKARSHLVNVSRRAILVYCKDHLLSPVMATADHGYYFGGDAMRGLRHIEALRTVCGDDFVDIKIILDLTAALERLQSDVRWLSRATATGLGQGESRQCLDNSASKKKYEVQPSEEMK
jgi:hypothetical protein